MMKKTNKAFGGKKYLALAIPLLMAAQAQGVEFNLGAIEGSFDSQLSLGSSWRVEGQDQSLLTNTGGEASNSDDSNKNYSSGDAFSQIFKGNHDLQIKYQNFGGFVRGKYWYDSALANNSVDYGHGPTTDVGATGVGTAPSTLDYNANNKLDDSGFNDLSKASGVALLDAFIYGEFEIMDMPLDVRLGKQVVSWGESTFIQGGVNAINPIDVNAFRRPGSELKEALLPVNMAYANVGLTENLSAEAFYQLEFEEHVIPGCGTFFSSNDYASEGCNNISLIDGVLSVSRDEDGNRLAKDDGQFGMAFRFISEDLGDTEFGLYAMNIHSRAPIVSLVKNNLTDAQVYLAGQTALTAAQPVLAAATVQGYAQADAQVAAGIADAGITDAATIAFLTAQNTPAAYAQVDAAVAVNAANIAALGSSSAVVDDSSYFINYQEDIQLAGLSFATNLGGMAISGELTHKIDVPVQINGPQLISAALGSNFSDDGAAAAALAAATDQAAIDAATSAQVAALANNNVLDYQVRGLSGGEVVDGFRLFDVSQAQVTAIKFIDQVAGANRITLIGEAAMTFVHSFDESSDAIKFGRSDIFGTPDTTSNDGFVTESSWGYRARVVAEYTDVIAGINLQPMLSWSHDVEGYAPQPGGAFQEGQQSLGLSVEASYLSMYSAAISYTQYMGGEYSTVSDRDFASISMGVQF